MLNKSQTRAVEISIQHYNLGNIGAAARGLSALHRSALKQSQQRELLECAQKLGLTNHPDFIIC
jgi:hypothetical protein